MRKIKITDMTLKTKGKSTEASLSFKEKIEIAKLLDKLNIDVIALPEIINTKADTLLVRTIASAVENSAVTLNAGQSEERVAEAWEAIKEAKKPRLSVELPVSSIQMEYTSHKKPDEVIKTIESLVKKCKSYCDDVDFIADDAMRSEPEFLIKAIQTAIESGASSVTVCDTEGTMLPDEFEKFICGLYDLIPSLKDINLAVQCAQGMDMSTACVILGLKAGAAEVKAVIGGKDYPAIESIAHVLDQRGDSCGLFCSVNYMELNRITSQISLITRTKRKDTSPFDNQLQSAERHAEILLAKGESFRGVREAVMKLGYSFSEDDYKEVYEAFLQVAGKKDVTSRELDAIVASVTLQVPATYKLVSYVINSGNVISATSHIKLEKDGVILEGFCLGDGPIDASFLAIEQIVGHHFELDDFQIQAVTEGREAMGSALVKLRSNAKLYSGNGISTDIIGASINAYISALNKIVYGEN